MLYNMMLAVGGVVLLFGLWVTVQTFIRRHSPELDETDDVLACRMCQAGGSCHCGLRALRSAAGQREGSDE